MDYWGFEGKYDPTKTSKNYQTDPGNYWGATNTTTGDISFGKWAFDDYETLLATYTKELYTSRNVKKGRYHELPAEMKGLKMDTYLEEALGYVYAYKNQGLYRNNKFPWQGIELYQKGLRYMDIAPPVYQNKFSWLYKIPRIW